MDEPVVVLDQNVDGAYEVVTLDDAITLVGDSVSAYDSAVDARYQALADSLASISSDVAAVADSQAMTAKQVSKLAGASDGDSSYVVVLDDTQWETVRDCWVWAKSGLSISLFLLLVCTLLVAAVLGNRLWTAFSQGWRNG